MRSAAADDSTRSGQDIPLEAVPSPVTPQALAGAQEDTAAIPKALNSTRRENPVRRLITVEVW